jgi:ABC-type dipeptide/oligopeptide/nickel transport system permease component
MFAYSLRRLIQLVPVLLLISFLVFMLIHIVPGEPVAALMGEGNSDAVVEQALRTRLGLDRSMIEQYCAGCPSCCAGISAPRSRRISRWRS